MGRISNSIRQSLNHGSDPVKAIACNVAHDHRIPRIRLRSYRKFTKSATDTVSLLASLRAYHDDKIANRRLPEFVYEHLNGQNILVGGSNAKQLIARDVELARVVSLNSLGIIFDWGKARGISGLQTFPGSGIPGAADHWLDQHLAPKNRPLARGFLGNVLDAMNAYAKQRPYQPSWATTWKGIEPFVDGDASRWLQAVGVSRPASGQWCMLLRYSVRDVGTLVRPTSLDAGDYPFHFTSPPCAMLTSGGHPADLSLRPQITTRPEYIHKQIAHTTSQVVAVRQTRANQFARLNQQRVNHYNCLLSEYGSDIMQWMTQPKK